MDDEGMHDGPCDDIAGSGSCFGCGRYLGDETADEKAARMAEIRRLFKADRHVINRRAVTERNVRVIGLDGKTYDGVLASPAKHYETGRIDERAIQEAASEKLKRELSDAKIELSHARELAVLYLQTIASLRQELSDAKRLEAVYLQRIEALEAQLSGMKR